MCVFGPLDGVLLIDDDYIHGNDRKVYIQLICSFRYGREQDEVMGLKFQKDMILGSEQIFPATGSKFETSKLQDRLIKKLDSKNAFPFTFKMNPNTPASVTLQPGLDEEGKPCGVDYFLKAFVGESETDLSHKRFQSIHFLHDYCLELISYFIKRNKY